ncbi:hypothetical protein Lal_00001585 [Lupinus albus]|nr:hypothetical protein Lal_00001585 [Lupinus albus]
MARPKESKKSCIGANIRVKLEPNNFNMVSGSRAYNFDHTSDSLKGQLHAPKATSSENRKLVIRVVRHRKSN